MLTYTRSFRLVCFRGQVGGMGWINNGKTEVSGDLTNALTSPNDPIFWPLHSNIDRTKMDWMLKQSAESSQIYYGYPVFGGVIKNDATTISETPTIMGIGLNDPLSSSWGFTDADLGINAHPDNPNALWTNADALCWLRPHTAPYRYEEFSPVLKPKTTGSRLGMQSGQQPATQTSTTWIDHQIASGQAMVQDHPKTSLSILVIQSFLIILFGTMLLTKYFHK